MTEKITLSIVSLIMFIFTLTKGDKWSIILTSGLTIGILITWIGIPIIFTSGILIYMLTALIILISNAKSKEHTTLKKTTLILSGIWGFIPNLFSIMHWPFANEIRLSMIIPITCYLIYLLFGKKMKELGYLTIINIDFLLRLIV